MATLLEQAQLILNTKNAIKEALYNKTGVEVTGTFSTYPSIINNMDLSGSTSTEEGTTFTSITAPATKIALDGSPEGSLLAYNDGTFTIFNTNNTWDIYSAEASTPPSTYGTIIAIKILDYWLSLEWILSTKSGMAWTASSTTATGASGADVFMRVVTPLLVHGTGKEITAYCEELLTNNLAECMALGKYSTLIWKKTKEFKTTGNFTVYIPDLLLTIEIHKKLANNTYSTNSEDSKALLFINNVCTYIKTFSTDIFGDRVASASYCNSLGKVLMVPSTLLFSQNNLGSCSGRTYGILKY